MGLRDCDSKLFPVGLSRQSFVGKARTKIRMASIAHGLRESVFFSVGNALACTCFIKGRSR